MSPKPPTEMGADSAAADRRLRLENALKTSGIGQRLMHLVRDFYENHRPVLTKLSAGKSHPRDSVRNEWRGIERVIFELEKDEANYPLIHEIVAQLEIPKAGSGRPAGRLDDAEFVAEYRQRVDAGEQVTLVKRDVAERMPGPGTVDSKAKRLERAIAAGKNRQL